MVLKKIFEKKWRKPQPQTPTPTIPPTPSATIPTPTPIQKPPTPPTPTTPRPPTPTIPRPPTTPRPPTPIQKPPTPPTPTTPRPPTPTIPRPPTTPRPPTSTKPTPTPTPSPPLIQKPPIPTPPTPTPPTPIPTLTTPRPPTPTTPRPPTPTTPRPPTSTTPRPPTPTTPRPPTPTTPRPPTPTTPRPPTSTTPTPLTPTPSPTPIQKPLTPTPPTPTPPRPIPTPTTPRPPTPTTLRPPTPTPTSTPPTPTPPTPTPTTPTPTPPTPTPSLTPLTPTPPKPTPSRPNSTTTPPTPTPPKLTPTRPTPTPSTPTPQKLTPTPPTPTPTRPTPTPTPNPTLPTPPKWTPITPPTLPAPTMESARRIPFLFPQAQSTVLPNPSFFSYDVQYSLRLPTNSFFQNFVLNRGDQPEHIHPYLIKSSGSSLSICYPSQFSNPIFKQDLTITASSHSNPNASTHLISSFDDLSVTLDFPNLRFFLVRGSPYLTAIIRGSATISISTIHAILQFTPNNSQTKYTIKLNNNQTWLLYASSSIAFTQNNSSITQATSFSGVIRIAYLPVEDYNNYESNLDHFSLCYPISGKAVFTGPFNLEYRWETKGWGHLLMFGTPLHRQLLSNNDSRGTILDEFKCQSIDGELVGIVGNSWKLTTCPISVTWHSIRGVHEDAFPEIIAALVKDVEPLDPTTIGTTSSYLYGKLIARAARFALIAEEVNYQDVLPRIKTFLKATVEPWLDGTFSANGFFYDKKWGGLVTKQGLSDPGGDFGFGMYNNHHSHLGYFLYAIAVLAKFDPAWGRRYKPQAYSLMADIMTLGKSLNSNYYPRLRNFDLWKLHSLAGGLTGGRNEECTGEAVNAYYSAALLGLAYGDTHLLWLGSMLSALEIQSAQIRVVEDKRYTEEKERDNDRLSSWRGCRLGMQVLPILPITEILFSDTEHAKELVTWAEAALFEEGVGEGWKGFAYAIEGVYDQASALAKVRCLNGFHDGNSLTNLLWWIHSRTGAAGEPLVLLDHDESNKDQSMFCWFPHYCH